MISLDVLTQQSLFSLLHQIDLDLARQTKERNAFLPFINSFIDKVSEAIQEYNPDKCLTRIQKNWIGFCIMSVLMTNTVCWVNFDKTSMGKRSLAALSWMFRTSKIPWGILLVSSTRAVLRRHGITLSKNLIG
ncbi:hypothetical protein [Desulfobacula sp.]|uniref:hypothetical protein n=1 Tax=Desulfobacula sp. TaxID=2593537 RepID=UPI002635CAB1|nr:hypothetical protein [Desulfobacula sp.]